MIPRIPMIGILSMIGSNFFGILFGGFDFLL